MKHENAFNAFTTFPGPVLTLFVNTSAGDASRHPLVQPGVAWFEEQVAAAGKALPPDEEKQFRRQAARIRNFLVGRHPAEKALVFFAGPKTWKQISLQVPVRNELHWGKPQVQQFLQLQCEYPPYGLIVMDHSAARFFLYKFGELTQIAEKSFEVDAAQWKKKDQGHVAAERIRKTRGPQREAFERRMEAQYVRLCRQTADQAVELSLRNGLAGTFLVGPNRLIRAVHQDFPRAFCDSVVLVPENLGKDSPRKLVRELQPFFEAFKQDHELSLVKRLQTGERAAITDPDEILGQIQNRTIHTLVVARGLDLDLQKCTVCGLINRSADPACALCRGARTRTTLREVLDRLIEAQDLTIEFVSGEAAALLMRTGGLGGWLRPAKASAAD